MMISKTKDASVVLLDAMNNSWCCAENDLIIPSQTKTNHLHRTQKTSDYISWSLLHHPSSPYFLLMAGASGQGNEMVKMCLFYANESGHARSDPIIDQQCASGHVHTFYGPQNFHPNTSYEDIRDTPAKFSSTPFVENQSLYWVSWQIRCMDKYRSPLMLAHICIPIYFPIEACIHLSSDGWW